MDDFYAFLFRKNKFGRGTMAIDQALESSAGGDDDLSDFKYS